MNERAMAQILERHPEPSTHRPGPAGTKHVATAEGFIWEPGPRKGGA